VGSKGLTESALKEVEIALKSHELIKVKLASDDREERTSQYAALSEALAAARVQQIGKIVVLYRKNVELTQAPGSLRTKSKTARRPATSSSRRTIPSSEPPRRGSAKPRPARKHRTRS
jgi:RNA-binding protein